MFCCFDGAMDLHCNRETTEQMPKYGFNARNSIMTDLGLSLQLWTKEEFDLTYLEK